MKKTFIYSLVASVALSGSLVAASADVSAASYKLSKGKLVYAKSGKTVKGKVVYKKRLYNNGKLAKGTILYKSTLYVNGKIKSGIVKYNEKFYSKGKVVSNTKVFTYKEKLHKGNQLYKGFKQYDDTLFKDGKPFYGIYKNVFYDEGYPYIESLEGARTVYSQDGTSITIIFNPELEQSFKINPADISVTDGAIVKSAKAESRGGINYLVIQIENVQMNHNYDISVNNLGIGNYGTLNLTGSFKSLSSKTQKNATYKKAIATYTKYSNYTDDQLKNISDKELDKLYDEIDSYEEYVDSLDFEDETGQAIKDIYRALDFIIEIASGLSE